MYRDNPDKIGNLKKNLLQCFSTLNCAQHQPMSPLHIQGITSVNELDLYIHSCF